MYLLSWFQKCKFQHCNNVLCFLVPRSSWSMWSSCSKSAIAPNTSVYGKGFSLVEVAIVLVIIGLLVGGLLSPLADQRERMRLSEAADQREIIMEALLGFAISRERLPCPATNTSNGQEAVNNTETFCLDGTTPFQHGFLPAVTLGLDGNFNDDTLMLDPWNNPWRYSITNSNFNIADGTEWDFIGAKQMSTVGMKDLAPDLVVCDRQSTSDTSCVLPAISLVDDAVLVVYSLGADWSDFTSVIQQENVGATMGPYRIANDVVFASNARSVREDNEFDDQVFWLSKNVLYARLIQAGVLP